MSDFKNQIESREFDSPYGRLHCKVEDVESDSEASRVCYALTFSRKITLKNLCPASLDGDKSYRDLIFRAIQGLLDKRDPDFNEVIDLSAESEC